MIDDDDDDVLTEIEKLAVGRATLEDSGRKPPYITHLSDKRVARLRRELAELGVAFGLQIGTNVPEPRSEEFWNYLGTVLGDVHVYARRVPSP